MRWIGHGFFSRGQVSAPVLISVAMLIAGSVGWHAWSGHHLQLKTGRSDTERVSCGYCHQRVTEPPRGGDRDPSGPRYISPAGMAVSPDGRKLLVAASGADRLLEVDLASSEVAREIDIPGRPHGVAISADGRRVAVTSRDGDRIRILDAESLHIVQEFSASEPLGVALSADGTRIFVASGASDHLLIKHLAAIDAPATWLVAGNEPYAVAMSEDARLIAVANRLVEPVAPGILTGSEVTLIDLNKARVAERRELASAHLSEGIVLSRDASFALASIVHFRNLLPLTQVARGAVMNSAVAFIETRPGGRTVQFPLDEVNAYFADPSGIALTPDDRLAFIAHGGAKRLTVLDVRAMRQILNELDPSTLEALADDMGISSRYVKARIPTLDNPRALVISPDGSRLYVAEHLSDTVAIVDTELLEVVGRIDLGGPRELTPVRKGELVFHDASVTFQGQFSCRSCHPDKRTDGLVWDFEIDGVGQNILETRSLRGIRQTAPFKWNGKNPDLATQCGPRFARVLTRSDPFPPEQLANLVAYIESLPLPPRRWPEGLDAPRERGKELFFRTHTNSGQEIPMAERCQTCHRPPLFTDRLKADVGTGGRFDTPHLFGIDSSEPYLHDGRALTLEEIWTVHSPDDTHGITTDLSKAGLNDLVIYLRSL